MCLLTREEQELQRHEFTPSATQVERSCAIGTVDQRLRCLGAVPLVVHSSGWNWEYHHFRVFYFYLFFLHR